MIIPTNEDRELVKEIQHLYNDNMVEGIPCGDWHIQCMPEHAARLVAMHCDKVVKKERAEKKQLIEGIIHAVQELSFHIDNYHDEDIPENTIGPLERQALTNLIHHLEGTLLRDEDGSQIE